MKKVENQNPNNLKKMVIVSDDKTSKPSKQTLNENAIKFKLNVDREIQKLQAQFKDVEASKSKILGRSQEAGVKAGARYECIYKNFLRDIRQFFSQRFDSYQIRMQCVYKLTPKQRYEAFPFQMLQFTLDNFSEELIEMTR
jgi:hypothetical protein